MYTFDELTQKYGPAPRKMDAYLRPLTLVETGEETSFPLVKILVVTALTVAATYGISMQFDFRFAISLFVACPLWLGVVIQLIRSASVTERNNKRLQEGPLVLGRIVQGHTWLYCRVSSEGWLRLYLVVMKHIAWMICISRMSQREFGQPKSPIVQRTTLSM